MTTGKNTEPLWWGLFSAGGVVAAFLVPIHILIFGFAVPLGWISDSGMLYHNWLIKIYLFVLITLPLYHWAHRFYFALNDMKLGFHASLSRRSATAALSSAPWRPCGSYYHFSFQEPRSSGVRQEILALLRARSSLQVHFDPIIV